MGLLKVGITGGIGSGKSTVAGILSSMRMAVYNSDARARWIQENDPRLIDEILKIFGPEAYLPGGKLNAKYIGGIVFGDPQALQKLNRTVHPALGQDFERWAAEHERNNDTPYLVQEAAILIESGLYTAMDRIVVVVAPEEVRIARVVARDGSQPEEVQRRMRVQMSDAQKLEYADYVLVADDRQMLTPQVVALHEELLRHTGKSSN